MILAIETSCDETSLALTKGKKIIKVLTASQIKLHQPHGGVVPHLAARAHQKNLPILFKKLVRLQGQTLTGGVADDGPATKGSGRCDLKAIAVTVGPGLAPALGQGIDFAKQLAQKYDLPLIPVNHLLAHLVTPIFDQKIIFPLISFIISGGHTELVLTTYCRHFSHTLLGQTLDDAAGEALDKIGRLLGLNYPAGPQLEKLAQKGNSSKFKFPLPLRQSSKTTLNFSFSGLKTAAARTLSGNVKGLKPFASSFQKAVVDHLLFMVQRSFKLYPEVNSYALSGGVSQNDYLRQSFTKLVNSHQKTTYLSPKKLCGDNAAMIGLAAHYFKLQPKPLNQIDRLPNLNFPSSLDS